MSLSRLALLCFASILMWPPPATAEDGAPASDHPNISHGQSMTGEMVELHVETILATNASQDFDTRLTDIRRQLEMFRYSSYRLVQEKRRQVGWGKQADFLLPGGRFLQVVPKEYANERIALQVVLVEGTGPTPLLSTLLSIRNHGVIFVGGRKHPQGTLIIRIGAAAGTPSTVPAPSGE